MSRLPKDAASEAHGGACKKARKKCRILTCTAGRFPLYCFVHAGLAQLVARNLAKVEVAGSNPVARSMHSQAGLESAFFINGDVAKW